MEFKIEKDYGTVKSGLLSQLRFLKVSWGSNAPKYDLRNWNKDRPLNGITFSEEELQSLKKILKDFLAVDSKEVAKLIAKANVPKTIAKANVPRATAKETAPKATAKKTVRKDDPIVRTLSIMPAMDTNYTSALNKASKEQIEKAIKLMEKGEGNKTRIKRCKDRLKTIGKSAPKLEDKQPEPEPEPEKKKALVIQFPTKKPEFETLDPTNEGHTYEECEAKLNKEREVFKDNDSQFVIDGLLVKCKEDTTFRDNVMREDKTFAGAFEYFFDLARQGFAIKINNNAAFLDNEMALEYAINYFNKK